MKINVKLLNFRTFSEKISNKSGGKICLFNFHTFMLTLWTLDNRQIYDFFYKKLSFNQLATEFLDDFQLVKCFNFLIKLSALIYIVIYITAFS